MTFLKILYEVFAQAHNNCGFQVYLCCKTYKFSSAGTTLFFIFWIYTLIYLRLSKDNLWSEVRTVVTFCYLWAVRIKNIIQEVYTKYYTDAYVGVAWPYKGYMFFQNYLLLGYNVYKV